MRTRETGYDDAQLGPVAAAVFAVCLTANCIAGIDGIERRLATAMDTLARAERVAASILDRGAETARRVADGEDGGKVRARLQARPAAGACR